MAATLTCVNVFQICITANTCRFLFTAKIRITTGENQQYERHFAYEHLSLTKRIFNLTRDETSVHLLQNPNNVNQSFNLISSLRALFFYFIKTREFIPLVPEAVRINFVNLISGHFPISYSYIL